MGLIADMKKLIYAEEVQYKRAVSESTWYKIGGVINFLLNRNHQTKQFFLNGAYDGWSTPKSYSDGLAVFEFDAEIFSVWAFNVTDGTAGTTELDIKVKPQASGSWTSIFSSRPKFLFGAGNDKWVNNGQADTTYVKAPVLTGPVINVNKGDAIRLDLISSLTGGNTCGVLVHYRPR